VLTEIPFLPLWKKLVAVPKEIAMTNLLIGFAAGMIVTATILYRIYDMPKKEAE
jgi:hypothetical protein